MRLTGFALLGNHFLATASSVDGVRPLVVAAMVCVAFAGARPAAALDNSGGLSSVRAQRFGREDLPNANVAGDDRFSFAFAAGDFNGDGASDLASGVPTSDGTSATPVDQCGQVVVRYGGLGAGLEEGLAPVVLGQFLGGFPEDGDLFGRSLAACDLNGDGFDDLAVGVPLEDLTLGLNLTIVDSGVVEVYYGGSAGLAPPAGAALSNNSIQAAGQRLGWALDCGDFDGNGFDDLVAGIPGGVVNNLAGAGRIRVWPGSPTGVGTGPITIHQDSEGMPGTADAGDSFGEQLAVGDFDDDGFADLAIAVPQEVQATPGLPVGVVQVVHGSPSGLTPTATLPILNPDTVGDPDEGSFGLALAAGRFDDSDAIDDLAIGSHSDDTFVNSGGAVYILPGSSTGLGGIDRRITPESLFGAGASAPLDNFGYALAAGDFDGDGVGDLAIGAPGVEVTGNADGEVTIVTGEVLGEARARVLRHGLEGIPGTETEHDLQFGQALAAGDFDGDGHADLAVGAPLESEAGLPQVGTATVLYGALFADGFESGEFTYWSDVETQS